MTPFALTKRQQSRVAEEGAASKRQKVSSGLELSRSTGIASDVSSSSDSTVWGRRLAGLIEDAWKVDELAQLLQETPEAEEGSLRERIWSSKQVCRASSEVGHQISSDEVLAASLVLDTFHKLPDLDRFRKLSKRMKITSCLSLVLECVYGGQFDLSVEDVSKGSVVLRQIIFGGTFEQAAELRRTLAAFLGTIITPENCLAMLSAAHACNEGTLYARAEMFCTWKGLRTVVEASEGSWQLTSFPLVSRLIEAASKAGKDSPFDLFQQAANWVNTSVQPQEMDEAMSALFEHIDLHGMTLSELQNLLDAQNYMPRQCVEKLAGAYLHLCTGCAM